MRSRRSCQSARVAATSVRASSIFAARSSGGRARVVVGAPQRCHGRSGEQRAERVAEGELVGDRQLDVDPLDAVGVIAETGERNDDVLVDLERVRVARDRRGARAVEPEFLPRVGGNSDEAFGAAGVGDADHFRGGFGDGVIRLADDVPEQHHLRPAVALRLGRVADGLHIPLVQMLEAGKHRAAGPCVEEGLDLDDRRRRVAHRAEKFEAHGSRRRRHPMQHEAGAGDHAVAAFLLDAGQAGQELVGDVLAEARLPKRRPGNRQRLAPLDGRAVGCVENELEGRACRIVDLAEVMVDARDLEPAGVGRHHAPRQQVVERGAPQHRFLAAGVHRDVAADARRVGGGRIDGEHETCRLRGFHHPARDDARAAVDRRNRLRAARGRHALDRRQARELFGVDHRALARQRYRASGVTGATAARDDGEAELDAILDQPPDLVLGIGMEYDERILDAPVGGVGDVRDAREAVEGDVVAACMAAQHAQRPLAQRNGPHERRFEAVDGSARRRDELRDPRIEQGVGVGLPPLVDLREPVPHRLDEEAAAFRIVDEVVLQIRIAVDDPDVTQHLEQHPRRAPGPPLAAQPFEDRPHVRAEQPDHDLAIGE